MKKFYLTPVITILFLAGFIGIRAQVPSAKLDQAELMKQLIGNWRCDIGKDTLASWDMIPYGSGIDGSIKYVTNGKIVKEGKGLYGYDKSIDKCVEAGIIIGKDIGIYALWFVLPSKFILVPYGNIYNPDEASFKMEGEFKSPDMLIETTIINNEVVNTKTWNQLK